MEKSTVETILAKVHEEEPRPRFIPTRYPYTYAADMLRGHPGIVPSEVLQRVKWNPMTDILSRAESGQIRYVWAEMEGRSDEELAELLADAYLELNGVVKIK